MASVNTDFLMAAEMADLDKMKEIVKMEKKTRNRKSTIFTEAAIHSVGETAAHFAAAKGKVDVLKWLLSMGTSADVLDFTGATPAHHACRTALGLDALVFLDSVGADIKMAKSNGNTCLHEAAGSGLAATCDFLMKKGLSFHALNQGGASALHLACAGGHVEVVQMFLATVRVDQDPGINMADGLGRTPVHYCAINGSRQLFDMLLERGAADVLQVRDKKGMTPFDLAAKEGHVLLQHYINEHGGGPVAEVQEEDDATKSKRRPNLLACLCR